MGINSADIERVRKGKANARRRAYYWLNPEKYRAEARERYHKNKAAGKLPPKRERDDTDKLIAHLHYERNREIILAKAKERYAKDPEFRKRISDRSKAWNKAHPEYQREYRAAHRQENNLWQKEYKRRKSGYYERTDNNCNRPG